jgi:hypothetical protein
MCVFVWGVSTLSMLKIPVAVISRNYEYDLYHWKIKIKVLKFNFSDFLAYKSIFFLLD